MSHFCAYISILYTKCVIHILTNLTKIFRQTYYGHGNRQSYPNWLQWQTVGSPHNEKITHTLWSVANTLCNKEQIVIFEVTVKIDMILNQTCFSVSSFTGQSYFASVCASLMGESIGKWRVNNVKLWCFLYSKQACEQTANLVVNWHAMTLMWHHSFLPQCASWIT